MYTDPKTGTVYTSPEVAKQYGVDVGAATSGVSIQQQTAQANANLYGQPQAYTSGANPQTVQPQAGTVNQTGQTNQSKTAQTGTTSNTTNTNPTNNSQVANNINQANAPLATAPSSPTAPSNPIQPNLTPVPPNQAQQTPPTSTPPITTNQILQSTNAGYQAANASSGVVPQNAGEAAGAVANYTPPNSEVNPTVAKATAYLQTNPTLANSLATVTQALTPTITSADLKAELAKITTDQNTLSTLNTEMMNINTIMNGTESDIRSEVTATGGFATESQVLALSGARNKVLIKQANLIANQISTAEAQLKNDQYLLDEERSIASDQFSQNSTIYQLAQNNYNQQLSAQREGQQMIISAVGLSGYVNGLLNSDPTGVQLAQASQLLGMSPQQLYSAAQTQANQTRLKTIQASGAMSAFVVNSLGEVWNTQTGYAYTSPEDFQQKTGMTLDQANAQGAIQPLPLSLEQQKTEAELEKTLLEGQQLKTNMGLGGAGGLVPGTTGSAYFDTSAPGYGTTPIPGAGGLTQAAIDQAALQYATTGQMPAIGLGSTGQGGQRKTAIENRAAEIGANTNIAANKAKLQSLTSSLTKQTDYQQTMQRSVNTVDDNLAILKNFADKVNQNDSPLINEMTNLALSKAIGSGDLAAFRSAIQTVRSEYSIILARGSQVTDTARNEAKTLIPDNITKSQLNQVLGVLYQEGQNVLNNANAQVESINNQINTIINPYDQGGGGVIFYNGQQFKVDQNGNFDPNKPLMNGPSFNQVGNTKASARTDRHNNPTAFTTDVAKMMGLVEGQDYTRGDSFLGGDGKTYYTAKLNGNAVATTIKGLDNAAKNGKMPKWSYINLTPQGWLAMTPQQKKNTIAQMYQHEGGTELKQYFV